MDKNNKKSNYCRIQQRGFSLTFAVLIGSLLTFLAIGLASLALKEISLTSINRASQVAFFAADSGAECIIYWDIHGGYYGTDPFDGTGVAPLAFPNPSDANGSDRRTFNCGDKTPYPNASFNAVPAVVGREDSNGFCAASGAGNNCVKNLITVNFLDGSCALVYLTKFADGRNYIESNGVNDCSASDNPYRVQRSIKLIYR